MREGWRRAALDQVATIVMGQSPPGDAYNTAGEGVPLLNGPTEFGPTHPSAAQWTRVPTKFCESGDILFCVRGSTTGRQNVADQRYCIGRGLAAVRGREGLADTGFLRFVLEGLADAVLREARGAGSTFPNITSERLAKQEIPVPPLDEQRRIAAVLSAIDAAVVTTENCLARTSAVCRAIADEFIASESHEWLPLEEVLADGPTNGRSPPARTAPPGVPTFSIAAVRNGTVSIRDHLKFADVPPESVAGATVQLGDVLVVRGNANPTLIGACGMVREEPPPGCIYPDILMRVRPDPDRLDAEFLVAAWNSSLVHQDLLARAKTTNGTFKVNGRDVATTRIPVPALADQRRIAALIRATHTRAESELEVLVRVRATKKAVADQLLEAT